MYPTCLNLCGWLGYGNSGALMLAHYVSLILLSSIHQVNNVLLSYKFSLSVSSHYRTSDMKRTLQVASRFLRYDPTSGYPISPLRSAHNATIRFYLFFPVGNMVCWQKELALIIVSNIFHSCCFPYFPNIQFVYHLSASSFRVVQHTFVWSNYTLRV
jgi:hypothetical protein